MSCGYVVHCHVAVIHANELENEVCHPGEVEDDDTDLTDVRFATNHVGGEKEEDDRYGECSDREGEFVGVDVGDDDEELHGKAQEEEKVEFEEGDVNLTGISMDTGRRNGSGLNLPDMSDIASSISNPQRCACRLSMQTHRIVSTQRNSAAPFPEQ